MTAVAVAGRLIDPEGARSSRFPVRDRAVAGERMLQALRDYQPSALVCSAAPGADLLALDAAQRLNIRRRIVLPFDAARFRDLWIVTAACEWGTLFDSQIATSGLNRDLVDFKRDESHAAHRYTMIYLLDEARRLAAHNQESVEALIAWDGLSHGPEDLTAAVRQEARARKLPTREILTFNG
jgi:hypothetical protein